MVMHARKCVRLNDGYFEKKSSHHYEDSMSKYSSKSAANYGNSCSDASYGKHRRNCSPSNGSNSHSRSGSSDSWSPSRSVYANKSSYSRRSKEKERERERERDRESKYYDNKKKNNSRSSRSPLTHESKQSYNKSVNNYSRNLSEIRDNDSKINSSSKRLQIGEWTEQMSSSGKRYYYNSKTQVSQWEKPKEWIEWEKKNGNKPDRDSHSVRDVHYRNNNNSTALSSSKLYDAKDYKELKETNSNNVRSHSKRDNYKSNDRTDDLKRVTDSKNNNCVKREINESPIGELSSLPNACNKTLNSNEQPSDKVRTQTNSAPQQSPTQSSQTSNLPKMLLSQIGAQGLFNDLSAEETLRAIHQAIQLTKKVKDLNASQQTLQQLQQLQQRHSISSSPRNASSHATNNVNESPLSTSSHHRHSHHTHHSSSHMHYSQHHHQSADGIRQELDLLISRGHINKSPTSEKSAISSTRHDSPPSNVSANLSSVMSSATVKPSVPTLTPSLANYFRLDLISHVSGWQAEHAERQANVYSETSHEIGSLQCTRVSAELKMARSLVRLTEIQSTLQEQRILFASQQIKNVEEWKGTTSHSAFHS